MEWLMKTTAQEMGRCDKTTLENLQRYFPVQKTSGIAKEGGGGMQEETGHHPHPPLVDKIVSVGIFTNLLIFWI